MEKLDYPECGKSRGLPVPESAVQSPDSPGNERVHVNSVQNPDFKEVRGRDSSQNENDFSGSSGAKQNSQSLNTDSFKSEKQNCQTSSQYSTQEALLPQGCVFLPSGWYMNVGGAYCGGCHQYGTLLQMIQM